MLALAVAFSLPDCRQDLSSSSMQLVKRELFENETVPHGPRGHAVFVLRQDQEPDYILEFSRRYGPDEYVLFGSSDLERDVREGALKIGAIQDRINRPQNIQFTSVDEAAAELPFDQMQVISLFKTVLYNVKYDEFMLPGVQELLKERLAAETQCAGCDALREQIQNWLDWETGRGAPGKYRSAKEAPEAPERRGERQDDDFDEL